MLVDKMEYQGQQGGGGAQDDAFYELLSSTPLHPKKPQHPHQQHQQQFEQPEYDYNRRGDEGMVRGEEVLTSYDFQSNSGSYGGVVGNGEDAGHKSPAMAPVAPSYPSGSSLTVIGSIRFCSLTTLEGLWFCRW